MSQTIRAIYENGVLVPLEALKLAEREQVRLTVESATINSENNPGEELHGDPLAGLRDATGIC